jgi:periplasmic protein TonB
VRFALALLAALAINLLLFLMMQRLIAEREIEVAVRPAPQAVDFVRLERAREVPRIEPRREPPPPRPPPPDEPTPLPPPEVPELPLPEPPPPAVAAPAIELPMRTAGEPLRPPRPPPPEPAPRPPPPPEPVAAAPVAPPQPVAPAGAGAVRTDVAPVLRVPPEYPPFALRARIEGEVTVEFTISTDGTVREPVIVASRPPDLFDRAVLRVIGQWRFQPQMVDGVAVEQRARQDVRFRLNER